MFGEERHTYVVDAVHAGSRLDAFLAIVLPSLSRSRIKDLITAGLVTVDGAAAKPAARVRRGQRIEMTVPLRAPATITPEAIPLDVVYEDADLLVINKPPGLTMHPGAGRASGTLANAVAARVPQILTLGGGLRPGIVHRLDKDTSGLLVVAKAAQALTSLQEQVAARSVRRTYLAIVRGNLAGESGTIDAPIGRHTRHRTKMAVQAGGRRAVTRYRVLERLKHFTLVAADLLTGRTHQIRVHFAHLGHPVAGDRLYGAGSDDLGIGRQALHAVRLQFRHPRSGDDLVFEAAPPPDFAQALERARRYAASTASGPLDPRRRTPRRKSGPDAVDSADSVDAVDAGGTRGRRMRRPK